jgi:hypothetical protein
MTIPNLSGLSDTVAILVALWLLAKTFMGTRNVDKAAMELLEPYREELAKAHCDVERLRERVKNLDTRVQAVEAQNEELRRYVRRLIAQIQSLGLTPVCTLNTESLGLISTPVVTEEED